MSVKCNKCNKEIVSFGLAYNADINESYIYDKSINTFKKESTEIENDRETYFYCTECGATLSKDIVDELYEKFDIE